MSTGAEPGIDTWLQVGAAIASAIAAGGAVWAAVLSWQTARKQLDVSKKQIDIQLHEKRVELYEKLLYMIREIPLHAADEFDYDVDTELAERIKRMKYVFDPPVVAWVDDEVRTAVDKYLNASMALVSLHATKGDQAETQIAYTNAALRMHSLAEQDMPDKFAPYIEVWRFDSEREKAQAAKGNK